MHAGDDDEPDTLPCYRHPGEQTALHCIECERPICVDCAVQAPVGIKCPDCARTPRAARAVVPVQRVVRGIVGGAGVAGVLGAMLAIVTIPYLGWILAYVAGAATGATVRWASGGYRDPVLALAATVIAVAGILWLPLLWVLTDSASPRLLVMQLVAAAFAAFGAHSRAN